MISVVIPTFNASSSLVELTRRIQSSLKHNQSIEIILIDDGSSDDTWNKIQSLSSKSRSIRGIKLSRNFGQHNALLCGIREANGSFTVTLDDDLQHSPEAIPQLLSKLEEGFDVVYGTPSQQTHSLSRYIMSKLAKWALKSTMGATVASQISAFRIFRTDLRDAFENYEGSNSNIDVMLTWATDSFSTVKVIHQTRKFGKSGYTFAKLIKHAMNMTTGFSTRPLKLATLIGFIFSAFGLIVFGYVIINWFKEGSIVPGFSFLASIISIFSGAQLVALGIIGEYLARMHVSSTRQPTFLISDRTESSSS